MSTAELTRLQKTVSYHTQRLTELESRLESISLNLLEPGIGYRRMKKSWDNTNEDRNFSIEQLSACKEKIAVLQRYDTDDISELINDVWVVDDLVPCLKEFNKIFQDTIDEKGLAYTHGVFKAFIQEKRGRWMEYCRTYKILNGREFLHSTDTLNLLKHLHVLHDESDPDYRGVRRLGAHFDWTYALPYYTLNIRLNGCSRC